MGPEHTLPRTTSKSSLWRSWNSDPTSTYETSLPRFPWLYRSIQEDESSDRELLRGQSLRQPMPSRPLPLGNLGYSGRAVTKDSRYEELLSEDLERGSPENPPSPPSPTPYGLAPSPPPSNTPSNLITWNGPDDRGNPHNWPVYRKWTSTILVSCYTFISPLASSVLAPALPTLADEFNTADGMETYLIMSIFLLAYAVGPFILAPLSEIHGRVVVLQAANLVFLIFNTACGFAQTKTQILLFRFLSGLGGAAPQALGGGVLSDCWRAEERGRATAVYSLAPFLGPSVGPILGGYLTQYMSWRWIFWVISMADAFVQVLSFLFLRETYRPKILKLRAKALRDITGKQDLYTEFDRPGESVWIRFRDAIARPFIMLLTQPAIQVTGLYRAYLYGLMYLVLASFPIVWEGQYGQETGRASLNYVSLGVGFIIGLQISGPLIDKVYISLKARHNNQGRPEFRIPLMFPTAFVAPGGLLIYGISAHFKTHWIVPNIGAALFALGLILSFQCAQTYIVDSYETYTASATGAAAFIRTMAGFSFPLFGPGLYDSVGIAWGNAILAGVAAVICFVVPILLWRHGEWIRSKSQYCAG